MHLYAYSFSLLGGYSLEPVGSFRWTILAIASFRFYHYFVLQPVSLVCQFFFKEKKKSYNPFYSTS